MTFRSPVKPGYPIGKVAFIEGYKMANGRPSLSSAAITRDIMTRQSTMNGSRQSEISFNRSYEGGYRKDHTKRLSSVASASGIDPRLISLYDEIEACVTGIQAIRDELAVLMKEEHAGK
ncbi:unnamed protein product [Aphanomyces euteiches]|nr:hypothetical protein LEN26_021050 [Aphanomyces euteiches]KAH9124876.1 hypothetical protein AeMF1_004423 [Aphanomyces euteiches]KAH9134540.1 hypothetical protein AeRB84_019698 [Aphanomyces euteiches]KAH9184718.1 hypothetical protein AeNC1_013306 [Aphanomyces euteiches]